MASHATGERQWPYKDITGFKPAAIHWPLRRAAVVWNEPKYRALATKIGGGRARLDLTVREP